MAFIKLKGHEFDAIVIKDSANRRAQKFKNNIISTLHTFGLTEDDISIELERVAIKRVPATASWYLDGRNMEYTYKASLKYVDNLYVISKLLELEVKAVVEGKKTLQEFIREFSEEDDVEEERKAARELIGVHEDSIDLDEINKKYKLLAKNTHPDMPTGTTEKFKELNKAHKTLKRELS